MRRTASPWIAVEAGVDAVAAARELRRAHERYFAGEARAARLRALVAASWRRSVRAGVDPAAGDVPVLAADELDARRADSALAPAVPLLRELLGGVADGGRHLMIVTDAAGCLLWVEGARTTRAAAEQVALVPGAVWEEDTAGTNAMGTALALHHPVQIFAAEHVRESVHDWTCAAAPLRHPATGALLGCVDLTAPAGTVHPHSLALVGAAARAAAAMLAQQPLPAAREVRLHALGDDRARLLAPGRELTLSRRHSEVLVLLAQRAEGYTAEELALELFGERGKPVTVRAELSRLRQLLGPLLEAGPYRLVAPVASDHGDVRALVEQGRVAEALRAYRGPLLPRSEAPGVVELRRGLDATVRRAVLASGDDALLRRWLESPAGRRDLPGIELLLRRRPRDPSLAPLGQRAARLRAEGG